MIPPDVNVPVHTHDSDPAMHEAARYRWDRRLSGALAWAMPPGCVRITAVRKIVARPLPVTERGLPYPTDVGFARFSGLRRIHLRRA